jgi:hypothetical protein
MTKAQAKAAGQRTYWTGKPCRNNHMAERYTSCGACVDCLREAQDGVRRSGDAGRAAAAPMTPERQAVRERLARIRLRTYPPGADGLLDAAVGLTLARHPELAPGDVVGTRQGTKPEGGTWLYMVNVDTADVPALRQIESALHRQYGPDGNAIRQQILERLTSQAEATRNNGETEWKFT